MKRLLCLMGALCVVCVACAEMDIPKAVVGNLDKESLCGLTGGTYRESERSLKGEDQEKVYRCFCGGDECGENVTCQYDDVQDRYKCAGFAYTLLPSGPCMMEGVISCGERIDSSGRALGYEVQCVNNRWTEEKACSGDFSCKIYSFSENPPIKSSKCGDCKNFDNNCSGGEIK